MCSENNKRVVSNNTKQSFSKFCVVLDEESQVNIFRTERPRIYSIYQITSKTTYLLNYTQTLLTRDVT